MRELGAKSRESRLSSAELDSNDVNGLASFYTCPPRWLELSGLPWRWSNGRFDRFANADVAGPHAKIARRRVRLRSTRIELSPPTTGRLRLQRSRPVSSLPHQVPNERAKNVGARKRRHLEEPPALDPLENSIRRHRPVWLPAIGSHLEALLFGRRWNLPNCGSKSDGKATAQIKSGRSNTRSTAGTRRSSRAFFN
jgi:hypothetical protein